VPIVILDTAGLRESADVVEQIGVERARRAAERADLILFVYDLTAPDWDADRALLQTLPAHTPKLLVGNKVDAADLCASSNAPAASSRTACCISALTGAGLDALQEAILTALEVQRIGEETPTLTHQRHIQAVADAQRALEQRPRRPAARLPARPNRRRPAHGVARAGRDHGRNRRRDARAAHLPRLLHRKIAPRCGITPLRGR
jgi:tRNA modification GTPase